MQSSRIRTRDLLAACPEDLLVPLYGIFIGVYPKDYFDQNVIDVDSGHNCTLASNLLNLMKLLQHTFPHLSHPTCRHILA